MQTAEECVAEAHGQTEQERGRFFGRSAGAKFRLRTVVSTPRHSATRQCHNKHANWWEFVTARITDLIKFCHRKQEGGSVSMQWFQDIRSVLQREVQIGLDEAMANSPSDDGWTKEQREQILKSLRQTGRQMFVDLLHECEEKFLGTGCVALAGLHHIVLLACQGGYGGATHLSFDHALPYLESQRRAFCSCDAKAGFWNDAVQGSPPLQAVLCRLVADDLTQHTDNQEACIVLFDV